MGERNVTEKREKKHGEVRYLVDEARAPARIMPKIGMVRSVDPRNVVGRRMKMSE